MWDEVCWSFLILSNPRWPLSTWSWLLAGSTSFPWELRTTDTLDTLCHSLLTGPARFQMLSILAGGKHRSTGSEILPSLYCFSNRETEALRNDLLGDSCQQVTRTDCSSCTCPAAGSRALLSTGLCPSMRQKLEGDDRGTQRCVIYTFLISSLLFLVTLYPKSSLSYKPYSDQIFQNQSQDPLGWLILSGGSGPEPNSQASSSFLLSSQWPEYIYTAQHFYQNVT